MSFRLNHVGAITLMPFPSATMASSVSFPASPPMAWKPRLTFPGRDSEVYSAGT